MDLPFSWVDVFAEEQFGGNQLCVFHPAPAHLDPEVMQRITREMNHAETVFLQPCDDGGWRIRIWVPVRPLAAEIPFAGHPILGAACAVCPQGGAVRFMTGVGAVAVHVNPRAEGVWEAHMEQPLPLFASKNLDRAWLEGVLRLNPGTIRRDLPVELADNGMRTLLIPLASPADVDRAEPDMAGLAALGGGTDSCVMVFAPGEGSVRCRVFCPFDLHSEDAATGSANGPMGEYLVRHGVVAGPILLSEQGQAIGRPSRLTVRVERHTGRTTAVSVGGTVQWVGSGSFFVRTGNRSEHGM